MSYPFRAVEQIGLLKRFQRDFFMLTGLTFDLVNLDASASTRLKAYQRFTPFCRMVRQSFLGKQACVRCDASAICRLKRDLQSRIYPCHLGLMDVVVPLLFGKRVIGALTSGQFLLRSPTISKFRLIQPLVENYGIKISDIKTRYFQLPVLSSQKAEAVIDLLKLIAEHLLKMEMPVVALRPLHDTDPLRRAQQFIETNYLHDISLGDAAHAAHLSPSRLAHIFQEKLQTNFVAYRNGLRIERAKFLLANTDLRIIEVAMQSGFLNLGNFNQIFRKSMRLSPRQYRNQHISDRI